MGGLHTLPYAVRHPCASGPSPGPSNALSSPRCPANCFGLWLLGQGRGMSYPKGSKSGSKLFWSVSPSYPSHGDLLTRHVDWKTVLAGLSAQLVLRV